MGAWLWSITVAAASLLAFEVSVKSEVYAALLSGAGYHGVPASRMLVHTDSIPIPPIGDAAVANWLRQFNAVPAELREMLRRPAVSKPAMLDRSLLPVGTQFISADAISAAFTRSQDDWPAFKRQYRSQGWVSFSDVLVTSDGLDALVYSEAHCGLLCGEGAYIWLHRTKLDGWSIMKSITSWIA